MVEGLVEIEGLRKVYRGRGGEVVAVDGVSFQAEKGRVVGLLGANGAGKTTVIKCISTLIRPTAGAIRVSGIDALKKPRAVAQKIASVLEGNRNIYWRLTPQENLEFFAGIHAIPARRIRSLIAELLESLDLTEKARAQTRKLSRGMQQKLALACALVKGTDVLLLDEPTLGLDVETSHDLRRSIRRLAGEGKTILLSSHDMSLVQDVCDRVVIINRGKIVTDDEVANLLELFRVSAYSFAFYGSFHSKLENRLQLEFEVMDVEKNGDLTKLSVELPQREKIFAVTDLLRQEGMVLESVSRQQPRLEEVFLRLIKTGEEHHANAHTA